MATGKPMMTMNFRRGVLEGGKTAYSFDRRMESTSRGVIPFNVPIRMMTAALMGTKGYFKL